MMKTLSILFALLASPALAASGPFFSLGNTDFVVLVAFLARAQRRRAHPLGALERAPLLAHGAELLLEREVEVLRAGLAEHVLALRAINAGRQDDAFWKYWLEKNHARYRPVTSAA